MLDSKWPSASELTRSIVDSRESAERQSCRNNRSRFLDFELDRFLSIGSIFYSFTEMPVMLTISSCEIHVGPYRKNTGLVNSEKIWKIKDNFYS